MHVKHIHEIEIHHPLNSKWIHLFHKAGLFQFIRHRRDTIYNFGPEAKSQILSSVAPHKKKKNGYFYQLGTCLGALENHVLLRLCMFKLNVCYIIYEIANNDCTDCI